MVPARARFASLTLGLIVLLLYLRARPATLDLLPALRLGGRGEIPNTVHYVWTQANPGADLAFQFKHFLSVYSIWLAWRPAAIYIHTNAAAAPVARARDGGSGKWSRLMLGLPGVQVREAEAPTHARNGQRITFQENRADFVRAEVLAAEGGAYVDFDVMALRDVAPLRRAGFAAVVGRMEGRQHQVNSGTILARPGAELVRLYLERMHRVYDGRYTTHSNLLLTGIAEHLVPRAGEVLVLDQNAFTPGSWLPRDLDMLYAPQERVKSNLEGLRQGDPLPEHDEGAEAVLSRKEDWFDRPENSGYDWRRHFYDSYMIHAFQPGVRDIPKVEGFEQLTPRYVLERRSNFARALYPVVKRMYDEGIVELDDAYDG